jgi:hypothetical protein
MDSTERTWPLVKKYGVERAKLVAFYLAPTLWLFLVAMGTLVVYWESTSGANGMAIVSLICTVALAFLWGRAILWMHRSIDSAQTKAPA